MKKFAAHLEKLRKLKRHEYHPLIHHIHKKHKISKQTLFYVKEYGPHSHVPRTIIKESIKILLLASIISSFGGLALEHIKTVFISIIPLIILLPALNDMVGDYGTIISSRFSTMLHEGKIKNNWWKDKELRIMLAQVFIVAVAIVFFTTSVALIVSTFSNYSLNLLTVLKIFFITLIDVILIVGILFFTSIFAGLYFYRKKEDPNNFLIPITTSIADFMNMFIISGLVILLF
jgi:mgtE-like transporter